MYMYVMLVISVQQLDPKYRNSRMYIHSLAMLNVTVDKAIPKHFLFSFSHTHTMGTS